MNRKPFITISNRDIYSKIQEVEKYQKKLYGTVRWHSWAIGVLIALVIVLFELMV